MYITLLLIPMCINVYADVFVRAISSERQYYYYKG